MNEGPHSYLMATFRMTISIDVVTLGKQRILSVIATTRAELHNVESPTSLQVYHLSVVHSNKNSNNNKRGSSGCHEIPRGN